MTNDQTNTPDSPAHAEPEDPLSTPPAPKRRSFFSRLRAWLFTEGYGNDLRDQLEHAVSPANLSSNDSFSDQERVMIANILRFGALRVEDVMVPRADIQAIEESATLKELLFNFDTVGHSRLPVYRETLDDPVGMVHVKDLLSWIAAQSEPTSETSHSAKQQPAREAISLKVISGGMDQHGIEERQAGDAPANSGRKAEMKQPQTPGDKVKAPTRDKKSQPDKDGEAISAKAGTLISEDIDLSDSDFGEQIKDTHILRDVLYVPPSMPVVNLLLRMQSTRVHLALVVDEYGGTDGLVSIEDLVEEVVGDIEDEHDEDHGHMITGRLETGLIASARTPIEDIEERLEISLFDEEERDDDIDTLGGYVFSTVGRVPVRGEIITHPTGLEIEVMSADPRRIKTLKIRQKTAE